LDSACTEKVFGKFTCSAKDSVEHVERRLEQILSLGAAEHWLLPLPDVTIMPAKILGKGGFGLVIAGRYCGSPVAVKVGKSGASSLVDTVSQDDKKELQHLSAVANEIRLMRHVRHPNIVLFHGACVDPWKCEIGLVFEFIDGTTLDKAAPSKPVTDDAPVLHRLCFQICCALRYLHSHDPVIVHSDLKPSNVMVQHWPHQVHAKLLDFGLSLLVTERSQLSGGTRAWMPPEFCRSESGRPMPSVDVFAFGRLMHMVMAGVQPPPAENKSNEECVLPWPTSAPFREEGRSLIAKCLLSDPILRPPIDFIQEELLSWMPKLDTVPAKDREYMSLWSLTGCSWQEGVCALRRTVQSGAVSLTDTRYETKHVQCFARDGFCTHV